ncbi:hypothetical protein [Frankia sp. AgB32]|uniref:hypothetical protein n=1 Tax=Frankia sp. AgB32 TaxID=631119 RepID=UPI00201054D7|nr:hypothetical protein [Frankia sp. AgB32]MCK9896973.1 hypothetical protein [Frankia sp. AgB32]
MARTAITVNTLAAGGVDPFPTAGDATNGHTYQWSPSRLLAVRNGSGASINVIARVNAAVDGLTVPDRTVAVPAGASRVIDLRATAYQQTDGTASIDLSASTTVTIGVLDLAR